MKSVSMFSLVAVAAALSVAPLAFAKDCGPRQPRPALPDGKTASEDEMKAGQAKITAYVKAANAWLVCMSDELKAGKDDASQVAADWAAQTKIFTSTPAPAK